MHINSLKEIVIKVGALCDFIKPGKNTALNIELTPEGHALLLSCNPWGREAEDTTAWRVSIVSRDSTVLYNETGKTAQQACYSMLYLLLEKRAADDAF